MRNLWVYAYQIVPRQPLKRLTVIRALLKDETAAARVGARTWVGRLVLERQATHILIVSDASGRNHSIGRRLEAELERLEADFSVTEPLAVAGQAPEAGLEPATRCLKDQASSARPAPNQALSAQESAGLAGNTCQTRPETVTKPSPASAPSEDL